MKTPADVENVKLRQIVQRYLVELKVQHPDWDCAKVLSELGVSHSDSLVALAVKAGFRSEMHPSYEHVCAVAGFCMKGVWSKETIARESGIALSIVNKVFEVCTAGYGRTPYGKAPYGGSKKFSTGKSSVPRRVTTAGQLSYRGCLYTLGAHYRGRNALVQERGSQLLVMFQDRPPLYLTRRPARPLH